jgi:hypothetical protein
MQRGGDLHQNAGATVFFAGELVQAKRLESGAQLGRENRNLCDCVVVKTARRRRGEEAVGRVLEVRAAIGWPVRLEKGYGTDDLS